MHQCIHWRRNGSTRGLGSAQGGGGDQQLLTPFFPCNAHRVSAKISHSRGHGTARSTVPPPMTTSQADSTVCCFPSSPPEISENILVICVVALGGGAQSPLHRFSRDALLTESDGDQGPTATAGWWPGGGGSRCVCCAGNAVNFNFQKTGAQAEIVWLFIFQSLSVVPYRTIE